MSTTSGPRKRIVAASSARSDDPAEASPAPPGSPRIFAYEESLLEKFLLLPGIIWITTLCQPPADLAGHNEKRRTLDPKMFLANERMFLQFFSSCVIMAFIGVTLGTLQSAREQNLHFIGIFWIFLSAIGLVFTFGYFRWRVGRINSRHKGHLVSTNTAPAIFAAFFALAIVTSAIVEFVRASARESAAAAPPPNGAAVIDLQLASATRSRYARNFGKFLPEAAYSGVAHAAAGDAVLLVTQDGWLAEVALDTRYARGMWRLPREGRAFAGVAVVDAAAAAAAGPDAARFRDLAYVGVRSDEALGGAAAVLEVSRASRSVLRTFALPGLPTDVDNRHGLVALEFVPVLWPGADAAAARGGLLYAASSVDGLVRAYAVPALFDGSGAAAPLVATQQGPAFAPAAAADVAAARARSPVPLSPLAGRGVSALGAVAYVENDGATLSGATLAALAAARVGGPAPAPAAAARQRYFAAAVLPYAGLVSFMEVNPATALPLLVEAAGAAAGAAGAPPPEAAAPRSALRLPDKLDEVGGLCIVPSAVGDFVAIFATHGSDQVQRRTPIIPAAFPADVGPRVAEPFVDARDVTDAVVTRIVTA